MSKLKLEPDSAEVELELKVCPTMLPHRVNVCFVGQ